MPDIQQRIIEAAFTYYRDTTVEPSFLILGKREKRELRDTSQFTPASMFVGSPDAVDAYRGMIVAYVEAESFLKVAADKFR